MCNKHSTSVGFGRIENIDVINYNADGEKCCFVEYDLEYPEATRLT
jgi:hypothetical protein